jgi:hypothetical protein
VFDARHGLHRTCGRHTRLKWCGIAGSRSHFLDSMLLNLTSAILCMRLQGVLTSWKSERLLKTCADNGSCHMMVVWRARLGDISRFEPTKSGVDKQYAKSSQNVRKIPAYGPGDADMKAPTPRWWGKGARTSLLARSDMLRPTVPYRLPTSSTRNDDTFQRGLDLRTCTTQ